MLKSSSEKTVAKTILVVENDVLSGLEYLNSLKAQGYEVLYANSGAAALDIINSDNYPVNLLLINTQLDKNISGSQIVKEILAKKKMPVIFLMNSNTKQLPEDINEFPSYLYLTKTNDRNILIKNIEYAFKHFSIEKEYQELLERVELYREALDSGFQIMGIIDTSGRIVDANKAAEDFSGLKLKDFINQPLWEIPIFQDHADMLREVFSKAAQGQQIRFELQLPSTHGDITCFDFSIRPAVIKENKVIYLIVEARDITELREKDQNSV